MYRSMFSSLWWVMKGLAVAPPGIMFIKGVSTYKQRNSSSVVTLDFDLLRPKKINNLVLRPARMSFNNAHYPFLSSNE